jgi:hypothetical protein
MEELIRGLGHMVLIFQNTEYIILSPNTFSHFLMKNTVCAGYGSTNRSPVQSPAQKHTVVGMGLHCLP